MIEALALELLIADGDDLVDDQDLRFERYGDREAETDEHPAGVDLDRRIDEVADPGEVDDAVHRGIDLTAGHAQDTAPFRRMFSRPVSSPWNPAPSSSSAETRPLTTTRPLVGR